MNFRDDPAELRSERVVAGGGIRTFEAFAMDLQTNGGKPVTSDNACPPDNFRAYSPQTAGDSRTLKRALRVTRRDAMSPDRHPGTDLTVVYS